MEDIANEINLKPRTVPFQDGEDDTVGTSDVYVPKYIGFDPQHGDGSMQSCMALCIVQGHVSGYNMHALEGSQRIYTTTTTKPFRPKQVG